MSPKDIEITLVAILKSTIEAQIPRTEWRTSVEHAVHVFQEVRGDWLKVEPSTTPQPGGAADPSPRRPASVGGPPSPRPARGAYPTTPPKSGGPFYRVTGADDMGTTRAGKGIRGFTLQDAAGADIDAKWIEGQWDDPGSIAKVEAIEYGDWIKGKVAHGERGNFLNKPEVVARPAAVATDEIPF